MSKACPVRDGLHEITYILLVVRVVPCIRHPEIIYLGVLSIVGDGRAVGLWGSLGQHLYI